MHHIMKNVELMDEGAMYSPKILRRLVAWLDFLIIFEPNVFVKLWLDKYSNLKGKYLPLSTKA